MKAISFFLLLVINFSGAAAQQINDAATAWPFDKFIGNWEMKNKRNTQYETWSKIDGKTMLGKTCKITDNGDTSNLEIILLTKESNGIFYTPTVIAGNNIKPIRFTLTSFANNTYTFENPKHDFPKRIIYAFDIDGSLHAFIDDGDNSKKRQDYFYKKVK